MKGKKVLWGFTLVELVVVVAILTSFVLAVILSFNPFTQIDKAKDSARQSDINEIRRALEIYYQDYDCFPTEAEFTPIISSNSEWSKNSGKTVFMKKVPLDPNSISYVYKGDDGTCPQWGVVFAKLSKASKTVKTCPLLYKQESCAPQGFDDTWACVTMGDLDCDEILAMSITVPTPIPSSTPTPTSVPGPTNTPTPTATPGGPSATPTFTPTPTPSCLKDYRCTGTPLRCNVVPVGTGDYCEPTCGGTC